MDRTSHLSGIILIMDRLSSELRSAERQIDSAFKSNALTRLHLAEAMWYLLAAFEHRIFLKVHSEDLSNRFQIEPVKTLRSIDAQSATVRPQLIQTVRKWDRKSRKRNTSAI
jgi:hypothetical protein